MKTYKLRDPKAVEPQKPEVPIRAHPAARELQAANRLFMLCPCRTC